MMSSPSGPVPDDHPMMIAWKAYMATDDYKNSKHWAMTIAPMLQHGDPDADRKRYSLMPVEQRERHVEGSLWAAFIEGWMRSPAGKEQADG